MVLGRAERNMQVEKPSKATFMFENSNLGKTRDKRLKESAINREKMCEIVMVRI